MEREKFRPANSGKNPREPEQKKKSADIVKKLLKLLKII